MEKTSRITGFYRLSPSERMEVVRAFSGLGQEDLGLTVDRADRMIENVIGVHGLPLGIATNFTINGRDYLIPMAIEEPSVVAGASHAARLVRSGGGFHTASDEPRMIGQIQVLDLDDARAARSRLLAAKDRIIALANEQDPVIVGLGGGAKDLEAQVIPDSPIGEMLIAHLIYDCRDAMGANTVNTACEAVAPLVEEITGGRVNLRILSNFADRRLASARCRVPVDALEKEGYAGGEVAQGIVEAYAMAAADPYRAATHNKGIMNGIDAVVIATGNDWRAIEAGAHAYAARSGHYTSLSTWGCDASGDLLGSIELPLAVGTVGGATKVHPMAQAALKILGVRSARELAQVMAAVGLAQNLAALRALAAEGIQKGHMSLHARQIALAAGACGAEVDLLAERLVAERAVRPDRAEELLRELRQERRESPAPCP
jgi:hydroxymethylglutaryl-CoA reductase